MNLLQNAAQEKAIHIIHGPVLIISCPGSGKTTTLVRRIHQMLSVGIDPASILMVTFTKAAAKEMQEKYVSLFSENPGVTFSTIHSLCYNILRWENLTTEKKVLDEKPKKDFLAARIRDLDITNDPYDMAVDVANDISRLKNSGLSVKAFTPSILTSQLFGNIYLEYRRWCKANNYIDYDDMLLWTAKLLRSSDAVRLKYQNKYQYIQCDEYQDVNPVQRDILYMLAEKHKNLCVVGDDDQSIYAFRGASPSIMLSFCSDFPSAKVIHLDLNYRSGKEIIDDSARLIKHNKTRFLKKLLSSRGEDDYPGNVIYKRFQSKSEQISFIAEKAKQCHDNGIPFSNMAVLIRTNHQAGLPVSILSNSGIPCNTTEKIKSIYDSIIFSDIHDYVALSTNNGRTRELLNVLNHPMRYFQKSDFRSCSYTRSSLLAAAKAASHGNSWQYEKAAEAINLWMQAFGPGKVQLTDSPVSIWKRMEIIQYDNYLHQYADFRGIDYHDMLDVYGTLSMDSLQFKDLLSWLRYAQKSKEASRTLSNLQDPDGIRITTMHKAKGLEWSVVFVIDVDEDIIPHMKSSGSLAAMEEERRLLYVAMTRAKDVLYVLGAGEPSPFLREISLQLAPPKSTQSHVRIAPANNNKPIQSSGRSKKYPEPAVGGIVTHKIFGQGVVLELEPGNKDRRLVIQFFSGETKTFLFPQAFASGLIEMKQPVSTK